jgi:hypothetical protein
MQQDRALLRSFGTRNPPRRQLDFSLRPFIHDDKCLILVIHTQIRRIEPPQPHQRPRISHSRRAKQDFGRDPDKRQRQRDPQRHNNRRERKPWSTHESDHTGIAIKTAGNQDSSPKRKSSDK